tara:strand:- start:111 stop:698 length:588 start_codon:yes stop_codon:yes gene_type:complete
MEDDTPFTIGKYLCGDPEKQKDLSFEIGLGLLGPDGAKAEHTVACGALIVGLNERRLPGLKLRSKLHEGTRLWLTPGSDEEKAHVLKTLVHSRCTALLYQLEKHECAVIFTEPVDHIGLGIPDYPQIVKKPMDLGTIGKKIEAGAYDVDGPTAFVQDCTLTFENCLLYNPVGTEARRMGETMLRELKQKWFQLGF